MASENPLNRFLDLEEQTNSVLEELKLLRQETNHYSSAGEVLDSAARDFTILSERLIGLTQKINEMIETLRNIGTPELLANIQKAREEVKLLFDKVQISKEEVADQFRIISNEVNTSRKEIADQLKIISDYERRSFFSKLFGSGPAPKQ